MSTILTPGQHQTVCQLLRQAGLQPAATTRHDASWLRVEPFAADGSTRLFFRLHISGHPSVILIAPGQPGEAELREARAALHIGMHLLACDAPVPAIYGFDQESGLLLCEDLGSTKLFDLAREGHFSDHEHYGRMRAVYQQVVAGLAAMQVQAAQGFRRQWCCDTPSYNRHLMLERESGYFLRAFWQDMLGQPEPAGLADEFSCLADLAGQAPNGFFLYRDFQSRNIMIAAGKARFIDYQGGRQGPLGYDLASLLIDTYVQLPEPFQQEIYQHYLHCLAQLITVDEEAFAQHYTVLALQRNLQILGAFAFLYRVRGKNFFAGFIRPALDALASRLASQELLRLPVLSRCVQQAAAMLPLAFANGSL